MSHHKSKHPILASRYELSPELIALVQKSSFSGLDRENTYHHLQEFEQVCSCHAITGMSHDTLKWKLFPFSIVERVKQWYTHTVGSVNRSWDELRDKFCLSFFTQSRIVALLRDVLCFQQNEKETIGAAWARFSLLLISSPNLSISDHVLLQYFYIGLDTESTLYLDIAAGGSFSHKTPIEGREILDRITENTSFVANDGSSQEEHTSSHEDILAAESDLSPPTTQDSALEPSSEPQAPKEEEIQPSKLPFEFEDDLFEDFGNTSNYLCTRKPMVPIPSIDPIEATFLRENIVDISKCNH